MTTANEGCSSHGDVMVCAECHAIRVDRLNERLVRYEAALREIIRKYGPPHPGEAYHIAKEAIYADDSQGGGKSV